MVINSKADDWYSGTGTETFVSDRYVDYPDCSDGFMMHIYVKTNQIMQSKNLNLFHAIYTLIKLLLK